MAADFGWATKAITRWAGRVVATERQYREFWAVIRDAVEAALLESAVEHAPRERVVVDAILDVLQRSSGSDLRAPERVSATLTDELREGARARLEVLQQDSGFGLSMAVELGIEDIDQFAETLVTYLRVAASRHTSSAALTALAQALERDRSSAADARTHQQLSDLTRSIGSLASLSASPNQADMSPDALLAFVNDGGRRELTRYFAGFEGSSWTQEQLDKVVDFVSTSTSDIAITGTAYSGKTGLAVALTECLVSDAREVISCFVRARYRDSASDVADAWRSQLEHLLAAANQPMKPVQDQLRALLMEWHERLAQAGSSGWLILDGIDEASDPSQVLGLLPNGLGTLRTVVFGRTEPRWLTALPNEHQFRHALVVALSPNPDATAALDDLRRLIEEFEELPRDEQAVLTALSLLRGPIAPIELAALVGLVEERVLLALQRSRIRRHLLAVVPAASLAHSEAKRAVAAASTMFEAIRSRLIDWVEGFAQRGWPDETPRYVVSHWYEHALGAGVADACRLVDSGAWSRLLRSRTGSERDVTRQIAELLSLDDAVDQTARVRLAIRGLRAVSSSAVPRLLPLVLHRVGHTQRALEVVRAVGEPHLRASHLARLIPELPADLRAECVEELRVQLRTTPADVWVDFWGLGEIAEALATSPDALSLLDRFHDGGHHRDSVLAAQALVAAVTEDAETMQRLLSDMSEHEAIVAVRSAMHQLYEASPAKGYEVLLRLPERLQLSALVAVLPDESGTDIVSLAESMLRSLDLNESTLPDALSILPFVGTSVAERIENAAWRMIEGGYADELASTAALLARHVAQRDLRAARSIEALGRFRKTQEYVLTWIIDAVAGMHDLARQMANELTDPRHRDRVLGNLAVGTDETTLAERMTIVAEIKSETVRADTLCQLALQVDKSAALELLEAAVDELRASHRIAHPVVAATIAEELIAHDLDAARDLVTLVPQDADFAQRAYVAVGRALAERQGPESISAFVSAVRSDPVRIAILTAVLPTLPEDQRLVSMGALVGEIGAVSDEWWRRRVAMWGKSGETVEARRTQPAMCADTWRMERCAELLTACPQSREAATLLQRVEELALEDVDAVSGRHLAVQAVAGLIAPLDTDLALRMLGGTTLPTHRLAGLLAIVNALDDGDPRREDPLHEAERLAANLGRVLHDDRDGHPENRLGQIAVIPFDRRAALLEARRLVGEVERDPNYWGIPHGLAQLRRSADPRAYLDFVAEELRMLSRHPARGRSG